jgi:hypothetical protein
MSALSAGQSYRSYPFCQPRPVYQILVSLNSCTHALELLPFITKLHRQFGVLVIVVEHMMSDLKLFIEYTSVGAYPTSAARPATQAPVILTRLHLAHPFTPET